MPRSLVEDLRDTSLEIVATMAENFDRGRRARDRCDRDERDRRDRTHCDRESPRGDFLYDYVRLNLRYLNELACLGTAYSAIPARMLERLYARAVCPPECAPCDDDEPRGQTRIAGPGDRVTFNVKLSQRCKGRQTAHVAEFWFKDVKTGKRSDDFEITLSVDGSEYEAGSEIELEPNETASLAIHVTVPEDVPEGRTFKARLNVVFSDSPPESCRLLIRILD